jgi:transcriptional regulator with GAF, ATPase, and Fis domain
MGSDASGASDATPSPAPQVERYDDAQRAHIARVVLRAGGRIDGPRGAAALLQVNPHTLRARMRRLGVVPASLRAQASRAGGARTGTTPRDATGGRPDGDDASLDAAMRRHIELALKACEGRIEGAHGIARLLDVNPHTLRARMRRLGVDWAGFRAGTR